MLTKTLLAAVRTAAAVAAFVALPALAQQPATPVCANCHADSHTSIAMGPHGAKNDAAGTMCIAADTVLKRSYDQAPVSTLYLFGRKEDLAFEQPVDNNPRQRHHVRFWKADRVDRQGRPLWVGSATYDQRVGLSHTTGQVTHPIAPDVDAERGRIIADLQAARWAAAVEWIDDFNVQREGRNGGGDPWRTDGRLAIVRLAAPAATSTAR